MSNFVFAFYRHSGYGIGTSPLKNFYTNTRKFYEETKTLSVVRFGEYLEKGLPLVI